MRSIRSNVSSEINVKNSRFIGILLPVSSEKQAFEELSRMRDKFPNANHYPFAFRLGNDAGIVRVSDDGEPQRTAGYPILDVLDKNQMTNCIGIVVRYFGGTLLGSSLLTRTYSKAISGLLIDDIFTVQKTVVTFDLRLSYAQHATVERFLKEHVKVLATQYGEVIVLTIRVEKSQIEFVQTSLNNILNQQIELINPVVSDIYE